MRIEIAVNNFFGDNEFVWAIPGTENHTANFYGDTYSCKLDKQDVIDCINCAISSWNLEDDEDNEDDVEETAIYLILTDLQDEDPDEEES